jgi:NADH-quinone oxidoreductase subunit J
MLPLFFLLSAVVVLSGLAVVALRNPIHSALSLVVNLLAVAALFAMLDAHFLAVVQVIVYAGAIMVLFLFVIMLLNIKIEAAKRYGTAILMSAGVIGALFIGLLVKLFSAGFAGVADPSQELSGGVREIGQILYTKYVFTFEAASLLIIAAIVGAVMLAKRRRAAPQLSMRKP